MKKTELLAPCGTLESVYAAVQNGADAIYLGGSRFSARAYASNFTDEVMIEVIKYCHLYNVKVYVTVNTLIKDLEVSAVMEYVRFLNNIGIDALIIQDLGIVYLIKNNFPHLELHASTQMTIHNGEGAKFFKNQGFKRVVLSRELSLKEIKYISTDLNIETEIFVHGALCICYSGQCLMSSLLGGRSGNRGRCAQPCRLPYNLIDDSKKDMARGYLLSPKDICTIYDIRKIVESGTSSLKIEGRMKRPEYVAGVVDIYRRAIDSVYENKTFDFESENKKLLKLFNREGFSSAYFNGNIGRDMMAYNFPKNTGIMLGKVNKDMTITLDEDLNVKDGLRNGEEGFNVNKIIKGNEEVLSAKKGERVKLSPMNYKKFDELFKTSDMELLNTLSSSYKDIYGKKNGFDVCCKFKIGEPIQLEVVYNGEKLKIIGDKVENAIKKPLAKDKLEENLLKSGNTPFKIDKVIFNCYEEGFLPVSAINKSRRELIEKIEELHLKNNNMDIVENINYNREKKKDLQLEKLLVEVSDMEQLEGCILEGVENILINPFVKVKPIALEKVNIKRVYLKIPNIIKEEFDEICNYIDKNLNTIFAIVTANAGIINLYKDKIQIIGDYKLNIFNKYALDFWSSHLAMASISVELNKKEISDVIKNCPIPVYNQVYGKLELMVSEYCPIGSTIGGKNEENNCKGSCLKGTYFLKDRKGEEFLVKTDKYCRSHIYNNKPLNLIDNLKELTNVNHRIDFVDESREQVINIIRAYKNRSFKDGFEAYTRGHYKRGVE